MKLFFLLILVLTNSALAEESSSALGMDVGYEIDSDYADNSSPRIFNHTLAADASYNAKDIARFTVASAFFFTSLNSTLSRYPDDSGLAYVKAGASRKVNDTSMEFLGGQHTVGGALNGEIPFRSHAQDEGYFGTLGLSTGLKSSFFDKKVVIGNSIGFDRVFNRYRFSPSTRRPSSQNLYSYKFGIGVEVLKHLTFSVDLGVRRTQFTDGFHAVAYKNDVGISYELGAISIEVSRTNGAFADDSKIGLWFVDQYRNIYTAGIKYSF